MFLELIRINIQVWRKFLDK